MQRLLTEVTANWSPGQRVFAFLAVLVFACIPLVLVGATDLPTRMAVVLLCSLMLWLGAYVAVPPTKDRLRRYSLYVAWGITAAALGVSSTWQLWGIAFLRHLLPEHLAATVPELPEPPIVAVLGLTWGGVVALNWIWRDRTAVGRLETRIEQDFPERSFIERLRLVCKDLENDLNRIDTDSNWSHAHYVSLEAEVEVVGDTPGHRHITDLLRAIRQDHNSRLFLILGDPGAGKSVALRKLCRDLLGEVDRSGRLPIYINLKEWRPSVRWTRDHPPDVMQLKTFILDNLKRRVQLSAGFLSDYFERMIDHGRIFFILDSFDEIPSVLDVDETSWLVRELSAAVTDLLAGGSEARGVLASRHYRRPRLATARYRLLELRPFSEQQIAAAIDRATIQAERVKHAAFVTRPDLGAVVRNPFLLGLMLSYVERHGGQLPNTVVDLYRSYISQRLAEATEQLKEHCLDSWTVEENAEAIARVMFETGSFGLEIPIAILGKQLPGRRIEETADLLVGVRIGRISPSSRAFSFVHRRFNEYFLVNRFRAEPSIVPLEVIPTDGRLRDAIVLYTAIAEPSEASRIAEYCMTEMIPLMEGHAPSGGDSYRRGLHSLRFLVDAFRSREDLLIPYAARVERFIADRLVPDADILLSKNAVEAIGLTTPTVAPDLTSRALNLQNSWLLETAILGARYLRGTTELTQGLILQYFLSIPRWQLLGSQAIAVKILLLSEHLVTTARRVQLHVWEFLFGCAVLILTLTLCPLVVLFALIFIIWMAAMIIFCNIMLELNLFNTTLRTTAFLPKFLRVASQGPRLIHITGNLTFFTVWSFSSANLILLGAADLYLNPVLNLNSVLDKVALGSPLVGLTSGILPTYGAILLICGLVGLPWYSICRHILWCVQNIREIARPVCISLVSISAYSLITYFLICYGKPYFDAIPELAAVCIKAVSAAAFGVAIIYALFRYQRARSRASYWITRFDGRRATIAEAFADIETSWGRNLFVAKLATLVVEGQFRSSLESKDNVWPDGRRPNLGDLASTRLAQLDEVWLGLDR